MNINLDISSGIATLAQLNAGFLAISLTLVALIPTLVEIVRIKSPNFLLGEAARRRLNRGLNQLRLTIWLFGLATILSILGLIWQQYFLFVTIVLISLISLLVLLRASVVIATMSKLLI